MRKRSVAVVMAVGLMAQVSQAGLIGLGDLPGGIFNSYAMSVSANGQVVVGQSQSASGTESFRWTAATGMVGLGDLPGGGFYSFASDTSADGSVVVGTGMPTTGIQGYRWTSGGMVALGVLSEIINPVSQAYGVSADGSVIAGHAYAGGDGSEAARWTQATGWVTLGDLPGGIRNSVAFGISNDGSVLVGYGTTAAGNEAFRWTQATGLVSIGDLPGGTVDARAWSVSGDGSMAVGMGTSASGSEAFKWTAGTGMVGLGDLPGGAFSSFARTVSEDLTLIGGSGTTAAGTEAFVWTQETGMVRLWDQLVAQGIDPTATGWSQLNVVTTMTPDGKVLTGYGVHNGNDEAFLIGDFSMVPSPVASVWSLAGMAVLGLVRRRKA